MTQLTQFFVAIDDKGQYAIRWEWRRSFTEFHYVAAEDHDAPGLPPILFTAESPKSASGNWTLVPVAISF